MTSVASRCFVLLDKEPTKLEMNNKNIYMRYFQYLSMSAQVCYILNNSPFFFFFFYIYIYIKLKAWHPQF